MTENVFVNKRYKSTWSYVVSVKYSVLEIQRAPTCSKVEEDVLELAATQASANVSIAERKSISCKQGLALLLQELHCLPRLRPK